MNCGREKILPQQDFLVPTTGYLHGSCHGRFFSHRKPKATAMHILILHFSQKQFLKTRIHLLSGILQRNNIYVALLILVPPQKCASLPHSQQIIIISVMLRDTICPHTHTPPQHDRTLNNFFLSQAYLKMNFLLSSCQLVNHPNSD